MRKMKHVLNRLPDYLGGRLSGPEQSAIEQHLESCKACRTEYQSLVETWSEFSRLPEKIPTPRLRKQLYAELDRQKSAAGHQHAPGQRSIDRLNAFLSRLWPRQPALQFGIALVCLLVGYIVGFRIDGGVATGNSDVSQLKSEVQNMQSLVMLSLMKTESASDRIRGANWSERINRPDQEVVGALFEALNYDPNVNVRLAALDALLRLYDQLEVKQGLIGSLLHQTSPLVQLTLLKNISMSRDAATLDVLKELLKQKDLNKTVRQLVESRLKDLGS